MKDLGERVQLASKEFSRLMAEYAREEEMVTAELKSAGKYSEGLDGNTEFYAPLNRKYDKLLLDVFDKYDLPRDTKLHWLDLPKEDA